MPQLSDRTQIRRLESLPALDGVRGIAIAAVVCCHILDWEGGFIGVDLFFVLSGFLITSVLLNEWAGTGTLRLRGFYHRRLRRLYPAMATTLFAFVVITLAEHEADGASLRHMLLSLPMFALYLGNLARWLTPMPLGVQHLWTLATEEQFYLVWPPVLLLLMRRRVSVRRLLVGLAAIFLAIVIYRALLTSSLSGRVDRRVYESPDTTFDAIILGCLLGLAHAHGLVSRLTRFSAVVAPLALLIFVGVVLAGPSNHAHGYYTWGLPVIEVVCGCIILACLDPRKNAVAAICSTRPLTHLGKISYSLYLIHPLVHLELSFRHHVIGPFATIGVSLVAAWLLYLLVEPRFRVRHAYARGTATIPVLAALR